MSEHQFQNVDEYIADLKAKLADNPQCGNHHYNLGVAYLSKRDFFEAEKSLKEAVEHSPTLVEAYVQLGGICMHRGDLDGCLGYNTLAAKGRPFFAVPWGNIGFVHLQRGEAGKAAAALEKAVKYDPNFVQALSNLGSAYLMEGDLERAVESCLKAVKIEPQFGPAYNNLALCHLQMGEPDKAREYVEKARQTGYDVPQGLLDELKGR